MRTLATALTTLTTIVTVLLTGVPAQSSDLLPPEQPGPVLISGSDDSDKIGLLWFAPRRARDQQIRRYVVRWTGGSVVVSAETNQVTLADLEPGRYVFRVKAVNRAGSSPWSRSPVAYIR